MFLLDTNLVSELRKANSGRIDPNVASWMRANPRDLMFLSTITLLELEVGILLMERRDVEQGHRLRRWLEGVILPAFGARLLAVDRAVAVQCAALHVPDPRPDRDAFIAATARVHGLTVVTRNVKDFGPMGVKVLNPWACG